MKTHSKLRRLLTAAVLAVLVIFTGCAQREDIGLPAPDVTPPALVSFDHNGGRIVWETDEDCLCVLLYGTSRGVYSHYGYSVFDGGTYHFVDLLDVGPGTYYMRVSGVDKSGNGATSDEEVFEIETASEAPTLEYTMVDVGWGDCHVLEFPGGTVVMVDAGWGNNSNYSHANDVFDFLNARGIPAPAGIDFMIGTHAHGDHYGGFLSVIPVYNKTRFLAPAVASESVWEKVAKPLQSYEVPRDSLREGQTNFGSDFLNWDEEHGVEVRVLCSGEGRFSSPPNPNSDSPVIKVSFGMVDILLTGDAETDVERRLVMEYGRQLDCEVLKVGHHGNNDATSAEFLEMVSPRVGFIPNSLEDNPGVFDQEIIDRLRHYGVDYFVSDHAYPNAGRADQPQDGNITVTTDGATYIIRAWTD